MTVPTPPRPRAPEIFTYVLIASVLCLAVASPALFGAVPEEFLGLIVVAAQTTPLLTALIFIAVLRPGRFLDLFALRWRDSWRVLGVGLAVLVGSALLQLSVGVLLGWPVRAPELFAGAAVAVLPLWAVQTVFALGEELGWRGWLASRLAPLRFWPAALVTGSAWVIWHLPALPLILGGSSGGSGASWEFGAAYLLGIASWAPLMLWLRRESGSVWPAVIVHGALNSLRVFLLQSLADSGGTISWAVEATGWVVWLGAAWLLVQRSAGRREAV